MSYVLGVDVGTSRTAAAIARLGGPAHGEVDLVRLGAQGNTVGSVLYLSPDGAVLVGEGPAASDAGLGSNGSSEHTRIARGFSRRIGDDVPLVVGGEMCTPQALTATMIMWVYELVAADQGMAAEHIAITHPAGWGAYRRELLLHALRQIGLTRVTLLPEPLAVAASCAAVDRVTAEGALAVYSLGGGTLETSAVRRTGAAVPAYPPASPDAMFTLLGCAESVDVVGGAEFDDALFDQVRGRLGRELADLDPADSRTRLALAWLRDECAQAKEQLSVVGEVTVLVQLPHAHTEVRVTRADFEDLIRPTLTGTVDALLRTVRAAGLSPTQLDAALLVGGSARIPLVAELVAARLDCPVLVEPDPEATAARGAAVAALELVGQAEPAGQIGETFAWERATSAVGPMAASPRDMPPQVPLPREPLAHESLSQEYTAHESLSQSLSHESAAWESAARESAGRERPRPRPTPRPRKRPPATDLDNVVAERGDPPPRPPVQITPMYVPERRTATGLVRGLKPSVLGAVVIAVIAIGVVLTVAGSALAAPPSPPPTAPAVVQTMPLGEEPR
jgi:molecular chaperone DnaK (HSP70)